MSYINYVSRWLSVVRIVSHAEKARQSRRHRSNIISPNQYTRLRYAGPTLRDALPMTSIYAWLVGDDRIGVGGAPCYNIALSEYLFDSSMYLGKEPRILLVFLAASKHHTPMQTDLQRRH